MDLGIAKLTGQSRRRRTITTTQSNRLPLTPEYASPEQLRGQTAKIESDVYSLGVILYELLTGVLPLALDDLTAGEIERRVSEHEPAPPSQVGLIGSARRGVSG